ncbi:MAG: hypothetical protein AB1629_08090 [Candidatus Omnitrophota bacterium]
MDRIQDLIPAVLINAADKFVQTEKDLLQKRNERFKSKILKVTRKAFNRYIFFGIAIIVIFFTFLLLSRSENAS